MISKQAQKLINENTALVKITVNKLIDKGYGTAIIDRDDMISLGYIGLIKAAVKFDPTRGIKFTTLAILLIKGQIIEGIRRSIHNPKKKQDRKNYNYLSLEQLIEEEPNALPADEKNDIDYILKQDAFRLIEEAINTRLTSREQLILRKIFDPIEPSSSARVAREIKTTTGAINQAKLTALRKLRNKLEKHRSLFTEA